MSTETISPALDLKDTRAVMFEIHRRCYEKVLREPRPKAGLFKEYTDIRMEVIEQKSGIIQGDRDTKTGQFVPGASDQMVKDLTYVRAPIARVPNEFRCEVSFDGRNFNEYRFMYGQRLKSGINRAGIEVTEPEITEKIFIGDTSTGRILVDGRYHEKIAFLDLHPYNAQSPLWWDYEMFEKAQVWLRPLSPYLEKSCNQYGCEYLALKEEERKTGMSERVAATSVVLGTSSIVKLRNAVTALGITIPGNVTDDPQGVYTNLLFEYAQAHPKEVIDQLWGPRPGMLEVIELCFRNGVLRFDQGQVTDSDGKVVAWLQVPSDYSGLDLHSHVVDTIRAKSQIRWYEAIGFRLKEKIASKRPSLPDFDEEEARGVEIAAPETIEAKVWKMIQDGKFRRGQGYWRYAASDGKLVKIEEAKIGLDGSDESKAPFLYEVARNDPNFFDKYK